MVVLSASVCTRGGKALVSRQYVEMTRLRVEGLLAAFPKLVGHAQQHHTFVETDSVRYVYQPLENHLYVLLITTKASNIVEDLSTLRLLAKVIPDVAGSLHENAINDHAFDLMFAFDEVLTAGGYREEANLSTIRTNLLMDSHEEKIYNMMQESKMSAAKDEMKKQQKIIKERQMQTLKQTLLDGTGQSNGTAQGSMPGFGGGGHQSGGGMFEGFGGGGSSGGVGSGAYDSGFENSTFDSKPKEEEPAPPRVSLGKGMQLGKGPKKKDALMAGVFAEDNLVPVSSGKKGGDLLGLAPVSNAPVAPSAPLTVVLEEKITVQMNREGGVEVCEVKGTLTVTANTEQGSMISVGVNKSELAAKCKNNWTISTHPKVSKPNYEKTGVLSLKDTRKGFPIGRPVGILRWSYANADAAPVTINCWPEDEGSGSINVNIEYELTRSDMVLRDVNILIPLGTTDPPVIESIDGNYKHDPSSGVLCWHQDQIDGNNSTGSLEFSIGGSDTDVFFPVQIMFSSDNLLCPIEVTGVSAIGNGSAIPNTMSKVVTADNYVCA